MVHIGFAHDFIFFSFEIYEKKSIIKIKMYGNPFYQRPCVPLRKPTVSSSSGSSLSSDPQNTLFVSPVWNGPVNTTTHFTTIQAAITQASSLVGSVEIIIYPGIYSETVTLNQPNVFLFGYDPGSVTIQRLILYPTTLNTLTNLTITQLTTPLVLSGGNLTCTNCVFDAITSISNSSTNGTFNQCTFTSNVNFGSMTLEFNECNSTLSTLIAAGSFSLNASSFTCNTFELGLVIMDNSTLVTSTTGAAGPLIMNQSSISADYIALVGDINANFSTLLFTAITLGGFVTNILISLINCSFANSSDFPPGISMIASNSQFRVISLTITSLNLKNCEINMTIGDIGVYVTTGLGSNNTWTIIAHVPCVILQSLSEWSDTNSTYSIDNTGQTQVGFSSGGTLQLNQCNINFTSPVSSIDYSFISSTSSFIARESSWNFAYSLSNATSHDFITATSIDITNSTWNFDISGSPSDDSSGRGIFTLQNALLTGATFVKQQPSLNSQTPFIVIAVAGTIYAQGLKVNMADNFHDGFITFTGTSSMSLITPMSVFNLPNSNASLFTFTSTPGFSINFLNSVYFSAGTSVVITTILPPGAVIDQNLVGFNQTISGSTSVSIPPQNDLYYVVTLSPLTVGSVTVTKSNNMITFTGGDVNIDWQLTRLTSSIT
jgi:hypothetical protein